MYFSTLFEGFVCCWYNFCGMFWTNYLRIPNEVGLHSVERNSFRRSDNFRHFWIDCNVFPG